jgi:Tfp pilus assembly protein PilZ
MESCKMSLEEKRGCFRKPHMAVVDYTYDGKSYREFIKNIGFGGVFIETSSPIPIGQEIIMTFQLAGSKVPLRKKGKVAWSGPTGFGVKFF